LVGLSTLLVACVPIRAQEPKPSQPPRAATPQPKAGAEAPAEAVGRLVEHLRQHPAQRSLKANVGRLYAIDVRNGEAILIADASVRGLHAFGPPTWSHDGRRILYDAFPQGQMHSAHLKAIELAEGRPTVTDLGPGNCPSFSPDDKRIMFYLSPNALVDTKGGVCVMQADGSQRSSLGAEGRPRWSPDGHRIMIISWSAPHEVTLMDARPEKSADLQIPGQNIYAAPSWASPDIIVADIGSEGSGDAIALIDVTNPQEGKVKEVL